MRCLLSIKQVYHISLFLARFWNRSIHFENKTIKLIQTKTKEPLVLPLLPDVCAALKDYIENERPDCKTDYIFLNLPAPYTGPMQAASVYAIVSRVLAKTQIPTTGRRRGPHALRSSLATTLLDEGNDYPVIQKILGLVEPDTTKSYVKVNVELLRPYALPVPAPGAEFAKRLGWMVRE